MNAFEGIVPPLAQALSARGYAELTPVQKSVVDPALSTADMLVSAQTGSGKTVAFGLAIASTLLGEHDTFPPTDRPLALMIAPTRELALQVKRELDWLYAAAGASIASCVGGMDMRAERRALERGAHIVVGTPGRLRDHIQRGSLDMTSLRAVVLDEADEMLDLGFREDLEFILETAPVERRTLMFSATVPRAIAALAKSYQRDAVRISTTAEQKQHLDIEYRALTVAPTDRENAIINVLRYYEASTALVFCATRAAVNHMTARFNNRGFSVVAMSGELSQAERTHALQAMRDGRARVCIATDVAARGIDLPGLELVIHADLPTNREALLHRSGRTGRAGRKGVSVLIVPGSARGRTERLLKGAGIAAVWANPPSAEEIVARDDARILEDAELNAPVAEADATLVAALLAKYAPDQIAGAFVRLSRGSRSAPEELLDAASPEAARRPREEFGESVWVSLSVGREQQAEPRWLLPMLCDAGQITKREIGAIRMQAEETFVQIAASHVDRFLTAIGPDLTLERGVVVRRLEQAPDIAPIGKTQDRAAPRAPARKPSPRPKSTVHAAPEQPEPRIKPVKELTSKKPAGAGPAPVKRKKPKPR